MKEFDMRGWKIETLLQLIEIGANHGIEFWFEDGKLYYGVEA